jgi:hypothetical protein
MFLRRLLRIPVIVFCLWHGTAIAVYTLPEGAKDPITRTIRQHVTPHVVPYLLWTSQWQLWNLFSPDPLRRVVEYRIDAWQNDMWVPVHALGARDIWEWRRADELKVLRQLEENPEGMQPLRQRYIRAYCEPLGLAPGTQIRLVFRYYIIPYIEDSSQPVAEPPPEQWIEEPGALAACPFPEEGLAPVLFP